MKTPIIAIDARLTGTKNTGDTSYWRGLIEGLFECFPDRKVYLFSDKPQPDHMKDIHYEWVTVKSLGSRIWSFVSFPKAAINMGANVVHTQYSTSPLLGSRAVTTIHDVSFYVQPSWFKPRDHFLFVRTIPASVAMAGKVLTVSQKSKEEIEHYIPTAIGKTVVTHNALSKSFQPIETEVAKKYLTDKFSITRPTVFAVSNSWARKNTQLAAEAFKNSKLAETHILVSCGPGEPLTPESRHLGYVDDLTMRNLYAAADCFILPSLHEGFGIPILEAFASGTPVICGTGGAIPEVAGDAAIICPDYKPETWANALNHLFDDSGKLEAMIKRGHRRVQDFSWTKTAELTMQAYEEVANG